MASCKGSTYYLHPVLTAHRIQGGSLSDVLMARFSLSNARQLDLRENDPLWKQIRQFLRGVIVTWGGATGCKRQMTVAGLVSQAGEFIFERMADTVPEPITIKVSPNCDLQRCVR